MTKNANFGPNLVVLGQKIQFFSDDVSECWLQVAKLQISHCYVKVYEKNIIESIWLPATYLTPMEKYGLLVA